MNTRPITIAIAMIATLGFGAALPAAEMTGWKFTEILPRAGQPGAASDAGGMSSTTREELTGPSLYFVSYVERPDGSIDPAYGSNPRGVFVFRTSGGHYVLRHVEIPITGFATSLGN